jgi:hypothetical protein
LSSVSCFSIPVCKPASVSCNVLAHHQNWGLTQSLPPSICLCHPFHAHPPIPSIYKSVLYALQGSTSTLACLVCYCTCSSVWSCTQCYELHYMHACAQSAVITGKLHGVDALFAPPFSQCFETLNACPVHNLPEVMYINMQRAKVFAVTYGIIHNIYDGLWLITIDGSYQGAQKGGCGGSTNGALINTAACDADNSDLDS